jgi:predicted MPP superfamily phosphohydrolase
VYAAATHAVVARDRAGADVLEAVAPVTVRYYIHIVPAVSRRDVLRLAGAATVGVGTGLAVQGYLFERHALRVEHVDLPMTALPAALDGLRVGLLTDVHYSELVPASDVVRSVELLNAERPELIVLGGDYVSFGDRAYMGPVAEMLGQLRAPHGIFAIIGNHDDRRYMPAALARQGIETLDDARTSVVVRAERLHLAGLEFWTRSLDKVAAVVRDAGGPLLLLAHDPRRIVEAARLGVPAVLSGHTHGGQIVLPGVGAIAAKKFPVASGRLTRAETEMYVSRGVGTVVVPIRINCPPEVAVVTLRARVRPTPP